ncbi:hypothetical protein GCM10011386_11420 [Parapedobacter defluvii]|uniref:Uncharacterized protein n=1 Tax=Parapedobacter defluvii TaxID=2045106 RepID=A0ABQ1LB87_9SPHI|nr:hypothetical protein [Parapedobacter defluvii]GGC21184.1 hypothetical protein GCM10011386_11420 [Parapedobacter defluvii]
MKTLQHIPMKTWATSPTPATTPAMIQAFWHRLFRERTHQVKMDWLQGFGNMVYADTYASPFIIRLYHNDPRDKRVAYLSVTGGCVEWRFGIKAVGFEQCPVVADPKLMEWLDSLFWFYTATESQKQQISRLTDIQRLVSERMYTIKKKQGLWKRNPS